METVYHLTIVDISTSELLHVCIENTFEENCRTTVSTQNMIYPSADCRNWAVSNFQQSAFIWPRTSRHCMVLYAIDAAHIVGGSTERACTCSCTHVNVRRWH